MVLCVSCVFVCVLVSLDGVDARALLSVAACCPARLQRLGDARYDACSGGDSGGGVANATYRRSASMVAFLGFGKRLSSLDGCLLVSYCASPR